ncbi:unnamed protein product [Sphagnum tenellum]
MSVMAAAVVREMGMMHLVVGSKSYRTASGVVTQALGRIDEVTSVNSEPQKQDASVDTKGTSCESLEVNFEELSLGSSEDVSETVSDTDTEDDNVEKLQPVGQLDGASEFEDTEFEELVLKEGPEEILQLTPQEQADEFMKEEISNFDDYADWIRWVSDAEEQKACSRESAMYVEVPAVLKAHRPTKDENPPSEVASSSECLNMSTN